MLGVYKIGINKTVESKIAGILQKETCLSLSGKQFIRNGGHFIGTGSKYTGLPALLSPGVDELLAGFLPF